ncbi:hypothetical protein PMW_113 [Pseudomonas phage phiPMW]|uniref:Uncharacterized protein n=1 Tax=Pseudomonas phage phiPMW TaxID=1815582 RepID=A0A1S5R1I8_9CAUD|nr:hypothetical protein FDG97_gp113 [Pseudomonas phage phiPMW]ANA49238.1 hypothetical protein PMW_113 [Pseudomonas phage phiPMW]
MAVEILKRGTVTRKLFFGECKGYSTSCGTEVRFLREDAVTHYNGQRDGEYATVACPVCFEVIYGYPRIVEV